MPFLSLTVHRLCRGCSFHRNEDIWESLETEWVGVRYRRGTGKELGCDSLSLRWKDVLMIVEVAGAEWMNEGRVSGRRIFSSHSSFQGSEDTERYRGTVLKAILSLNSLKQTVNGEQECEPWAEMLSCCQLMYSVSSCWTVCFNSLEYLLKIYTRTLLFSWVPVTFRWEKLQTRLL